MLNKLCSSSESAQIRSVDKESNKRDIRQQQRELLEVSARNIKCKNCKTDVDLYFALIKFKL